MKHVFLFIAVVILFNCKPEKEEPKPLTAPVLTTMEAGDITAISALSGGAISSDGGSPVTARGIVWSVSHNPTLSDSVSEEGTGIGSFTSDLTPLKYSTTYYVRAYATNSIGTTYGNEVTFNTKAAVPSDGLVGWWPFNGNANDESGNGNDGVVNGATLTNDRLGFLNSSFGFNGNDSWIETVDPGPINLNISVSFWYKSNESAFSCFLAYGGDSWGTIFEVMQNYWAAETVGPCFGPAFHNYGTLISRGGAQIPDGSIWHSVTLVLPQSATDLNSVLIYVDGVQLNDICSFANYGAPPPSIGTTKTIRFGRNWVLENGELFFKGVLDDIAIYNRALTAEEIQKIYNGTGF